MFNKSTAIKVGDFVEIKKGEEFLHLIGRFGTGKRKVIKVEKTTLFYEPLFVSVEIDGKAQTYYSQALKIVKHD